MRYLLLLLALSGCATANLANSPENYDVEQARKAYVSCMNSAASHYAKSKESLEVIFEVSKVKCQGQLDAFKGALFVQFSSHGKAKAEAAIKARVDECIQKIQPNLRMIAVEQKAALN